MRAVSYRQKLRLVEAYPVMVSNTQRVLTHPYKKRVHHLKKLKKLRENSEWRACSSYPAPPTKILVSQTHTFFAFKAQYKPLTPQL